MNIKWIWIDLVSIGALVSPFIRFEKKKRNNYSASMHFHLLTIALILLIRIRIHLHPVRLVELEFIEFSNIFFLSFALSRFIWSFNFKLI